MMQEEMISFRASPVVASRLYAQAEESGVSVSEYLRGLIREKEEAA